SLSFNFSSFDQSSLYKIRLQGNASFTTEGIQLTRNQRDGNITDSVGRVAYGEPLLLWDPETRELTDFTTRFAFAINDLGRSFSGDGIAFFLSSYPSAIPPSSLGGSLGLFNSTPLPANSTINNTVAVEFDTFKNDGFDISANHIGIDVNSVNSSAVVDWRSNIKNGNEVNAWVSYNASTHNLSVLMTYAQDAGSGNSSLSYLIDLRDFLPEKVAVGFSAATGSGIETHALLSWSFNSSLLPKRKSKMGLVVGVVIGVAVLMVVLGSLEELEFDRNMDDEFERERGPKRFAYQELADATRNFSEEEKLGEGGFGSVYRGYLKDSKLEVAIKRISRGSKQGRKEYVSEVKIISRLRHRNLVQLVGWCHDRGEFSLVYEFMPNGSLDSYLYSTARLLEWPARHRVALGLASALLYLHEEWEQCVVHRDVKPSNVMLDSAFNAKLGDFGLARLVDHDRGSQTTVLAGTMGYLAPECVNTGKASKDCPGTCRGGPWTCMLSALFCLWIVVPSATCLSFNLSFLDPASRSGIELQGNATWNSTDGIQLTNDTIIYNVGRAVYREPLLLWDARTKAMSDFTTHFSFIIRNSSNTSSSGDGLAFFMAPYPSPLLLDSSGGPLGIFKRGSLNSTVPTVAVEFDTYQNEWDVDDHHVGIDVNSIVSQKVASWNGSLKTGMLANAWVSYDAITRNLSVFLTYADNPVFAGDSVLHTVIDLRDHLPANVTVGFSAATGQVTETHAVLSWSFSSSLQPRSIPPPTAPTASDAAKSKSKTGLIVGLVIGAGALMLMPGLLLNAADREEDMDFDQTTDDDFTGNRGPKRFAYKDLARATRNFSDEGKLGEGGFGSVYRGHLKDLKLDVAIKRVSRESRQGRKEYVSEVKIISRLRHRNLVQLVGWCHDRGEFLLVYEFMPNGSLDSYLYSPAAGLGWPARHKIALGLASALLYLHEEWEQCVMHRDVKPSNIMLDSAFNAKLGDFGLARLVDHDRNLQTTDLAGTRVYIAPECFYTGKPSKESDVYSFGIVALEIACGRRPVELKEKDPGKEILVEWVWELYGRRTILEAADARLNGDFDETQMECLMVVGLWCAHPDYNVRPSIRQAINALNLETPLPELPPKMPVPMYYTPWSDVSQSLHASS
ncbi:unnamed protein product, partial [Musa banksii]